MAGRWQPSEVAALAATATVVLVFARSRWHSAVKARAAASPVVLLTRDSHADGPWLKDLREALLDAGAQVKILPLSAFARPDPGWRALVNRVSDAAPPAEAKLCMAAMRGAELLGVPVINSVSAYALATSKVLHYELFAACGAPVLPYVVVRRGGAPLSQLAAEAGLRLPLLLKPSAGGFGKGISMLETREQLEQAEEALQAALGEEGVALLQEYRQPEEGYTYRAWFLSGRIHCSVRVRAPTFNACVGGVPHESWDMPPDISQLCERIARRAAADCGSIEWLYANGQPWFFDFNLLSTLPQKSAAADRYSELAAEVIRLAERRR